MACPRQIVFFQGCYYLIKFSKRVPLSFLICIPLRRAQFFFLSYVILDAALSVLYVVHYQSQVNDIRKFSLANICSSKLHKYYSQCIS